MIIHFKNLLVIILLAFANLAICQNLDSLGLNDNSLLNSHESTFLNAELEQQRQRVGFDFSRKQVGFATGHGPKHYGLLTKSEFFKEAKDFYNSTGSHLSNLILVVFTEQEKQESGGYEAVVVSWSKFGVNEKARKELVDDLKSGT